MNRQSNKKSLLGVMRLLSALSFVLSLACIGVLLVSDGLHGLRPYAAHQSIGAMALILVGFSYVCLQLSIKRPTGEMLQGLFLGAAFLLWGGEQLLPPRRLVTLMDALVVSIFVIDLSFIIWNHLKNKDHETP